MKHLDILDVLYPHTLIPPISIRAERLEYLYPESNEVVSVPNVWYNQTYSLRAAALRDEALEFRIEADTFERDGLIGRAEKSRELAGYREAAARWMEFMGNPEYPVAIVR